MLHMHLPARELWDSKNRIFLNYDAEDLKLEHSLLSITEWESKWKVPYLSKKAHSPEKIIDYIRCMCIKEPKNPDVLNHLSMSEMERILGYIGDEHTATKIYDIRQQNGRGETLTNEVIYYYMIYYGIPFSCEKWHLARLLTLIRVCRIKGGTNQQAMDLNSLFSQNKALNKARRASMNTRG